jgi:hypothetical protein
MSLIHRRKIACAPRYRSDRTHQKDKIAYARLALAVLAGKGHMSLIHRRKIACAPRYRSDRTHQKDKIAYARLALAVLAGKGHMKNQDYTFL